MAAYRRVYDIIVFARWRHASGRRIQWQQRVHRERRLMSTIGLYSVSDLVPVGLSQIEMWIIPPAKRRQVFDLETSVCFICSSKCIQSLKATVSEPGSC